MAEACKMDYGEKASVVADEPVPELVEPAKGGIGDVVASHYNNLQERGKAARSDSRYLQDI